MLDDAVWSILGRQVDAIAASNTRAMRSIGKSYIKLSAREYREHTAYMFLALSILLTDDAGIDTDKVRPLPEPELIHACDRLSRELYLPASRLVNLDPADLLKVLREQFGLPVDPNLKNSVRVPIALALIAILKDRLGVGWDSLGPRVAAVDVEGD